MVGGTIMPHIDPDTWDSDREQRKRDKRRNKRKQQQENRRRKKNVDWCCLNTRKGNPKI